ncbi:hypothetical protein SUGI_1092010 [Cryptomeria japonica]|nr:hypothetical protein SUGI_1092010 [Cryptomeria japonica]
MISAGRMDCVIPIMCAVVLRVSHRRMTLKVGGQVGVLGEDSCNALSQRAPPMASWNQRTDTCPKKKLSHTTTSQQWKAAGLLVSTITPVQHFLSVASSELPHSTSERSSKGHVLLILLPSTIIFAAVLALLLAAFFLLKRRRLQQKSVEDDLPISLKAFTYKELRIATENFKHTLGSGAFGSVLKGTLPDSTLVAVKRLEGSARAEKQFRAEIDTIGRIQHLNLVRLYGFCVEGSRRLLVYAYMPFGSLNSSLFCEEEKAEKVLDWKTRFEIALGTARGLVYLHEECRDRRDFSRVLTTTRGTRGYLAPEWISGLPITPKVDVYSFGKTLLEIISGRRNLDLKVEESRFYFPTWAASQIQRGNIIDVVDARIAREVNIEEVRRAAVVGELCIQDNEDMRPSMGEVLKILEGTMEAPAPPISRSPKVLIDQVEDDDSDISPQRPCIPSGFEEV